VGTIVCKNKQLIVKTPDTVMIGIGCFVNSRHLGLTEIQDVSGLKLLIFNNKNTQKVMN
jgi:hypothetical protein